MGPRVGEAAVECVRSLLGETCRQVSNILMHFLERCLESNPESCRTKIQYRQFETNIPRKGTARLQSQFLHLCFCERFIYSSDRSDYSAAEK
jgi:hypothetical protein